MLQEPEMTIDLGLSLEEACSWGDLKTVKSLISKQDVNCGCNYLHLAAYYGREEVVEYLIEYGLDVNGRTQWQSVMCESRYAAYALHAASEEGHVNIVRILLENGADVDLEDRQGRTCLMLAVQAEKLRVVQFLIDHGVSVRRKNSLNGRTALHYAVFSHRVDVVSILIKYGADVDVTDDEGLTPLMCAVKDERGEMVSCLIDHKANMNVRDANGKTALHHAVNSCHFGGVSTLIRYDACAGVGVADNAGLTPFMYAVREGPDEILSFLIDHGANRVKGENGETALHYAVNSCHVDVMSKLIACYDIDLNATDKRGIAPLMLAVSCGYNNMLSCHFDHVASTKVKKADGERACHCEKTHYSIAEKLLLEGANINVRYRNSITPLMIAVGRGDIDRVSLLVRHGADVKLKDRRGGTALHFLCENAEEIIKVLVDNGANIDEEDNGNHTPLQTALSHPSHGFYSHTEAIISLVEHGADVTKLSASEGASLVCIYMDTSKPVYIDFALSLINAGIRIGVKDGSDLNPLLFASAGGHEPLVKSLILTGFKVNLKNKKGSTALHEAARINHIPCGMLLAEAGADIHIKDKEGKTALDLGSSKFQEAIHMASSFTTKKTVCVIGNACSGKTTLITSLQNENESFLNKCKHRLFGVTDICDRTAGIDPIPITSRKYGNVVFFDFAGQHEYHGPHEMFIESIFNQRGSTVTIIVVVKATEEETVITQQLKRWLNPLRKVSSVNPIQVIAVGSFMDKVKSKSTAKEKLGSSYMSLKASYSDVAVTFQGLCFLNCRQPYSRGFADLCQYLQDVPISQVQANTSYSLCWVISQMKASIRCKSIRLSSFAKWIDDNKDNLPKNMPSADDVCKDLSSTGHYLYLPNKEEPLNSWLVLDLPSILHEVYGTLFSPSKKIVNEFGLLSIRELRKLFCYLDVKMIREVLFAMDFCIEVDPVILKEEILKLTKDISKGQDFLFFPALVSSKCPKVFEDIQSDQVCHSLCWQFQANPNHFVSPRLIQTIILRLSALHVLHSTDTRQHYCSVWWNGLFWQTAKADIAIQIIDNVIIQVIGRSMADPNDLCCYLSKITCDIKSTIAQINPSLSGCAYIIHGVDPKVLLSDPSSPSPHQMYPLGVMLECTRRGETNYCLSRKPSTGPANRQAISDIFSCSCPSEDALERMYYGESFSCVDIQFGLWLCVFTQKVLFKQ